MKKRRKAQAEVITTVLMILLVLAAIVIIWNIVNSTISKSSKEVNIEVFTTRLEIESAKLWVTGGATVKVKRKTNEGEMNELKFIFHNKDGTNNIVTTTENLPLGLETKSFYFSEDELPYPVEDIEKISVVPVLGEKLGIEVFEPLAEIKKDETGNRILDLSESLVSWWKFDGDYTDSAGDNDGTPVGTPQLINNELVLDGGDYIDVGSDSSLDIENQITMSAWVKRSSTNIGQNGIIGDPDNFRESYTMYLRDGTNEDVSVQFNDGSKRHWVTSGEINADEWIHLVGTYDGSKMKLYINKVKIRDGVSYGEKTRNFNGIRIGHVPGIAPPVYFYGSLDNIIIFNKSLSQDEIEGLFNEQKKE